MYEFRDTTDFTAPTSVLPAEAVAIDGRYLEDIVDGYRTLYTKGRESLGAELSTMAVGSANGEILKSRRYPARTIVVGFQLIASTNEAFRESFNHLNNLLACSSADFVFYDETDKFYTGTPIFNAEVDAGQNSVKGEWEIYCAYPFKRSVEPVILTMDDAEVDGNTATWTIEYDGGQPAKPLLRASFAGATEDGEASEDGDCGYVAFMDANENIIQLGNPAVMDVDEYTASSTLINRVFSSTSGWSTSGGNTWKDRAVSGSVSVGTISDAHWNSDQGQTQYYAKPTYNSGTGWRGAILYQTTTGAVNFDISVVHRLCVSNASQTGTFECGARDANGVMVAGFVIDKLGNGTIGNVYYIINDTVVGQDTLDLSYYNTNFGYCNMIPVYKTETYTEKVVVRRLVNTKAGKRLIYTPQMETKTRQVQTGWRYTQSNLVSTIRKSGDAVTFDVANLSARTFRRSDIEYTVSTDLSMYMGTNGTPLDTNAVHSVMWRSNATTAFAERPNVFTAGDVVQADCNDATVCLFRGGAKGGRYAPMFGALGNDWETFEITQGTNYVRASWSEWVNANYKPDVEIEYNEVYI